jgi:hypothetical protein
MIPSAIGSGWMGTSSSGRSTAPGGNYGAGNTGPNQGSPGAAPGSTDTGIGGSAGARADATLISDRIWSVGEVVDMVERRTPA